MQKTVPPETSRTIDEALRMYEREESISLAVVEWIRTEWREAQGQKLKAFAKAIMDDFHAAIE